MMTTINPTFLFDHTQQQGRLELSDRDRLDLLHRMSTQDLLNMQRGEGRPTVLTTALARIIDRVIVYNGSLSSDESVLLLTHQPAVVRGWLQRHIFFQDKVRVKDISAETCQFEVHGPSAVALVEGLSAQAASLPMHGFERGSREYGPYLLARTFSLAGDGFVIVAGTQAAEPLQAALLRAGAQAAGPEQFEALRIAAGLPGPGHELTEDYIPLEANLWDSVSFSKGCYIGQEIIARMESRNRMAKTLVKLSLTAEAPVGAALTQGERQVGTLTSVARLASGQVIALGFVRPDVAADGTALTVVTQAGTTTAARVEGVTAQPQVTP
jgi:folate-binding protein YgfZ